MAEISLGDVDVEAVLLRLTRHAQGLFGAARSLGVEPVDIAYAGGDGPEDLAMNLLLRFLDPRDDKVRWNEGLGRPTTDGVYALLRKALDHDFLDLKKSKRYRTTVYLEKEDRDSGRELTLAACGISRNAGRRIVEAGEEKGDHRGILGRSGGAGNAKTPVG
jgi:hypothetical protein